MVLNFFKLGIILVLRILIHKKQVKTSNLFLMNKKIAASFVFVLLNSMLFTSCIDWFGTTGKGNIVTESRTATNFQSIELITSAKVDIVKGDTFIVEVSDYENIIQNLSVKVVSNNLIISTDPISKILINSKAHVTITMPDSLKSVALSGSGDLNLTSPFKDLNTMIVTGSGNISAIQNLNVDKLNASILGSGNITAYGNVKTLTALISGSGNIKFADLTADGATCTITGSGNIYVKANNTLKAVISGSGNIEYSGSPIVDSSITGSGTVIHK